MAPTDILHQTTIEFIASLAALAELGSGEYPVA
jgi:hypothetical protein